MVRPRAVMILHKICQLKLLRLALSDYSVKALEGNANYNAQGEKE